MSQYYTSGPTNIPTDFTKPTKQFKVRVFWAILALFAFVFFYLGLMVWFAYKGYNLIRLTSSGASSSGWYVFAGILLLFLSVFMCKSLFIWKKRSKSADIQLQEDEQKELFDFVNRLADEAGAPRPHKIFLSSRVNASVFYDLSILNLIFPAKKNLEIGMGLLNVLSLGEFKAVLAHEFGHFAQRSMLLGRYVYTAQQIAVRVVHKRDVLDEIIRVLSGIDLRIAWIGWLISIIVWAIRSLVDVIFSIVVFAERALSREMEFQADRMAVSLTGSDALIHALHRLGAADEGYRAAIGSLEYLLNEKKAVPDLFVLQSNYIAHMKDILGNPAFGDSPQRDVNNPQNRIFTNSLVNPPEMWSTHPADKDREERAKETYIYAEIDERPAIVLMANEKDLKKNLTHLLIQSAEVETTEITEEESLRLTNERDFSWSFLNSKYRGYYLGRYSFLLHSSVEELYSANLPADKKEAYNSLYSIEISKKVTLYKELQEEIALLNAVAAEVRTAEKRRIMHRGVEIKRSQIKEILTQLEAEKLEVQKELAEHDRMCRTLNFEVAQSRNATTAGYLKSLAKLVHYAEHSLADLADMSGKFSNTLMIALADRRVSESEMNRLVLEGRELEKILLRIYSASKDIVLDGTILKKMDGKPYADHFEAFRLGSPTPENMNDWVNNVSGWIALAEYNLNRLRNSALEQLLVVEDQVQKAYFEQIELQTETDATQIVENYALMTPGNERKLEQKLNLWNRFHAGIGLFPTTAKFMISGTIIFFAAWVGDLNPTIKLTLFNGLSIPVEVSVDGIPHRVTAWSSVDFEVSEGEHEVRTTDLKGQLIESFTENVASFRRSYVYNVANAGYFISYELTRRGNHYDEIGPARWMEVLPGYVGGDVERAYSSYNNEPTYAATIYYPLDSPEYMQIKDFKTADVRSMVCNHLKWDRPDGVGYLNWFYLYTLLDMDNQFLWNILKDNPENVACWRYLQDNSEGAELEKVAGSLKKLMEKFPQNGDFLYLSIRDKEDRDEKNRLYMQYAEIHPDNAWIANAAAYSYAEEENWLKAYQMHTRVLEQSSGLGALVAKDVERIYRTCRAQGLNVEDHYDLRTAKFVNYMRQLEFGEKEVLNDNPEAFFYWLSVGQFENAEACLDQLTEEDAREYAYYLAASEGRDVALVLPLVDQMEDETSGWNVAIKLALKLKYGRDAKALAETFKAQYSIEEEDVEAFEELLNCLRNKRPDIAKMQKCMDSMESFVTRAECKLMARIVFGKELPDSWNEEIANILFITERPYLEDL